MLVFQFLVAKVEKVLELPIKHSGQKDHSFNGFWRLQLIWPYCDGRRTVGNKCIFTVGDSGTPQTLLLRKIPSSMPKVYSSPRTGDGVSKTMCTWVSSEQCAFTSS